MDIGLQIKKFREQQKISQEELALKIFVPLLSKGFSEA